MPRAHRLDVQTSIEDEHRRAVRPLWFSGLPNEQPSPDTVGEERRRRSEESEVGAVELGLPHPSGEAHAAPRVAEPTAECDEHLPVESSRTAVVAVGRAPLGIPTCGVPEGLDPFRVPGDVGGLVEVVLDVLPVHQCVEVHLAGRGVDARHQVRARIDDAPVLQIGTDLEGGLDHLAGGGEEAGDVTSLRRESLQSRLCPVPRVHFHDGLPTRFLVWTAARPDATVLP